LHTPPIFILGLLFNALLSLLASVFLFLPPQRMETLAGPASPRPPFWSSSIPPELFFVRSFFCKVVSGGSSFPPPQLFVPSQLSLRVGPVFRPSLSFAFFSVGQVQRPFSISLFSLYPTSGQGQGVFRALLFGFCRFPPGSPEVFYSLSLFDKPKKTTKTFFPRPRPCSSFFLRGSFFDFFHSILLFVT